MKLRIAGIGTAAPGEPVEQERAAEVAVRLFEPRPERSRMLAKLYRWTRVASRHSVLPDAAGNPNEEAETHQDFFAQSVDDRDRGPTTASRMSRYESHAPALALAACEEALEQADVDRRSLTHLVTVSCTGFGAPGVDIELVRRLGLSPGIARSHIGFMGCHGALNGLRVARSFVEADPGARVLLCAVELCTLHAHYGWDPEQIVANAIFSDGAAALVGVGAGAGGGREEGWQLVANDSEILPDSEDAMTWRVRDHGFEMTLSPRVPELIRERLTPWLERWLQRHDLTISTVGAWAVHPGGPRILDAVAEATGLGREPLQTSYEVLARYGNMSSPTVLFLLQRLRRDGARPPLVTLGFGPGLTIEAALIR